MCKVAKDASFLGAAIEEITNAHVHDARHSVIPLGGGRTQKIEVAAPKLTEEEKAAISRNELYVFLYGRIDYSDIFGEPHWTTWAVCYETIRGDWSATAEHNEQA